MLKTQEREINGTLYQVAEFPAMRRIRLAMRIAKMFGGGLGALKKGSLLDQDVAALAGAICSKLDENEASKLILDLFGMTNRAGKGFATEAQFDKAFEEGDALAELLPAIAFILEVNFGGFMAALDIGSQLPGAVKAPESPES